MTTTPTRVLYIIVCAAGPADRVIVLIEAARERGWDTYVIATPSAHEGFIDVVKAEKASGHPVRSAWRKPGEPGSLPTADAIVVAPATYNTINKWVAGAADTYALGLLAELGGVGVPIIVLPYVNANFANNRVYQRSLEELRAAGIHVMVGPGMIQPHQPRSGAEANFPWMLAIEAVDRVQQAP